MASDGLTWDRFERASLMPRWLVEAVFVGFLLLVFVGLKPFQIPPTGTAAMALAAGGGDLARQLLYVAVFGLLAIVAVERRSLSAFTVVPLSLTLLLLWCFISADWSVAPDITLRRAGLELIVVSCAMLGIDAVGPRRSLELLRYVLIGVLIVNWISIPIVPQAKHLPGDPNPALVGDWRGLYYHKNIAGAVCAITAIIELHFAIRKRSWFDGAVFLATVGFLVMTHSKSSMGFLALALAIGAVYGWGWKRDLDRLIAIAAGLLVVVVGVAVILSHTTEIARKLDNPAAFTGRSAIWQAEAGYIADHPWLGAGYGTFADTGQPSPLTDYVDNAWIEKVSHGHNGYLQLLVTTGAIGLLLAMAALIILPFLKFWRRRAGEDLAFKALLFTLFAFVVLHNIFETDYLEGDGPAWVLLLMVIAMLRGLAQSSAPEVAHAGGAA